MTLGGYLGRKLIDRAFSKWEEEDEQRKIMQALYTSIVKEGSAMQLKALEPAFKNAGIEIGEDVKGTLIGRDVVSGVLEQIGGQEAVDPKMGGTPTHPGSIVIQPGEVRTEFDPEIGKEVDVHEPSKVYRAVPEAEQKKREKKASLEADLEFQKENVGEIVGMEIARSMVMFPTKQSQRRAQLKMEQEIQAEMGSGKTKDVTIYNEAGDQRSITMPQTVAASPEMRADWINTNYKDWSEVKVKEKQLEDLKLAAWEKALVDPKSLTATEKQLINWEERPSLSKALSIAGRDPTFGVLPIEERIRQVNAIADTLDMMEQHGANIFEWYPDAKYDHKTGQFYVMEDGVKKLIRLKSAQ